MPARSRSRLPAAFAAGGLLLMLLALPATGAAADDDGDIGLSVTVGGDSTTPPSDGGSGGGGGGGSTEPTTEPSSGPEPSSSPSPGSGDVNLGDILYVGGLDARSTPALDPFGGTVHLAITVQNASHTAFAANVRFWMTSSVGNTLDERTVRVPHLAPGEKRTVRAELHRAGQWVVVMAHARVTPPAEVEGTKLSPITRDATVAMFPWLISGVGCLTLIGALGFHFLPWRALLPWLRPRIGGV